MLGEKVRYSFLIREEERGGTVSTKENEGRKGGTTEERREVISGPQGRPNL